MSLEAARFHGTVETEEWKVSKSVLLQLWKVQWTISCLGGKIERVKMTTSWSVSGTAYWESLANLANHLWFAKLKSSKLVLTINNLLADLLIHQTFFHQRLEQSQFAKLTPLPNFPAIRQSRNCKVDTMLESMVNKSSVYYCPWCDLWPAVITKKSFKMLQKRLEDWQRIYGKEADQLIETNLKSPVNITLEVGGIYYRWKIII